MMPYTINYLEAIVERGMVCGVSSVDGARELTSGSIAIHAALIAALRSNATVDIEFNEESSEIHRVLPFSGQFPLEGIGTHVVERLATQRTSEADHLEVFISGPPDGTEVAYNVTDQFLQQVLVAAYTPSNFRNEGLPLYITTSDREIVRARLSAEGGT